MRRNRVSGMLLGAWLCALASLGWGQSAAAPLPATQLTALRGQVQEFQNTLNRDLQTNPFVMLQDAKGIYLPHFGVVFHMELNLAPLRTLSAFDVRPYTEQELRQARDTKLERIRQIKDYLSNLLRDHGAELNAVPPDQNVAVVVHLFNLSSERTDGLPMQIVIEASRGMLADPQARKASEEEFRKKVTFFDF